MGCAHSVPPALPSPPLPFAHTAHRSGFAPVDGFGTGGPISTRHVLRNDCARPQQPQRAAHLKREGFGKRIERTSLPLAVRKAVRWTSASTSPLS